MGYEYTTDSEAAARALIKLIDPLANLQIPITSPGQTIRIVVNPMSDIRWIQYMRTVDPGYGVRVEKPKTELQFFNNTPMENNAKSATTGTRLHQIMDKLTAMNDLNRKLTIQIKEKLNGIMPYRAPDVAPGLKDKPDTLEPNFVSSMEKELENLQEINSRLENIFSHLSELS